jgi:hypothetical protein
MLLKTPNYFFLCPYLMSTHHPSLGEEKSEKMQCFAAFGMLFRITRLYVRVFGSEIVA